MPEDAVTANSELMDELARLRAECEALRSELRRARAGQDEAAAQAQSALEQARRDAATAAAAAEQHTAELEAVMVALPNGVAICGPNGQYLHINDYARTLFGVTPHFEYLPLDERLRHRHLTFAEGRRVSAPETPLARALNGEIVRDAIIGYHHGEGTAWISIGAAPLRGPDGQIAGAVLTFADVTGLRAMQDRLEAANRELAIRGEQLEARNRELQVQAEELRSRNEELKRLSAQLEAERASLQIILDKMPAGVLVADIHAMRLVLANEQMARLWRVSMPVGSGLDGYRAFPGRRPDGRPLRPEEWPLARATLRGETVEGDEIAIVRGDGTPGAMLVSAEPIRDRDGNITGGVSIAVDLTERKAMEDELRRTRDELATVLRLSSHLTSNLALEPMLAGFIASLRGLIDCTALVVCRLQGDARAADASPERRGAGGPGAGELAVVDYQGPGDRAEVLRVRAPVDASGGMMQVLAERRPILVADLAGRTTPAPDWPQPDPRLPCQAAWVRSWLGVPLMVRDRLVGVAALAHAEPGRFTVRDAELALAYANHAAVAMENARLYDQAKELAVVHERQRLARDLHDLVSQTLFSASLTADVLPRLYARDPAHGQKLLDDLRRMNRGALAELRALLVELRPQALVETDLGTLLTQLAEAAAGRSDTPISVAKESVCPVPGEVQVALYRVAQEALNNVDKHARAHQARLRLNCTPGPDGNARRIVLCIADDGVGFDPEQVPGNCFGLSIMRERAAAIDASLEIRSRPGAGTTVTVTWVDASG